MNPVVEAVRKKYPGVYDDLTDDQLTLAIGKKAGGAYDDIKDFAEDFKRVSPYVAKMEDVGISGGEFENVQPVELPKFGQPGTFTRGLSKALTRTVAGATSPSGVATGAALMVPGVGPALGLGMSGYALYEAGKKAKEAFETGSPEAAGEAAGLGLAGNVGAFFGLKGLAGPKFKPGIPPEAPKPSALPKAAAEAAKEFKPSFTVGVPEEPAPAAPEAAPEPKTLPEGQPAKTEPARAPTTRSTLASRILQKAGLDQPTADRFADWVADKTTDKSLEDFRNDVLAKSRESGLQFPNEISLYRTEPSYYEAMGFSAEQVAEHVRNAEIANRQAVSDVRTANARVLEELESGKAAPTKPTPVAQTRAPGTTTAMPEPGELTPEEAESLFLERATAEDNAAITAAAITPAAPVVEPSPTPAAPEPTPAPPAKVEAPAVKEPWQMTAQEAAQVTGLTWDKWMDSVSAALKDGRLKESDPAAVSSSKTGYQVWRKMKGEAQAAKPAAEMGKEMGAPFTMTFEQFLNAPREGRLLDELRKLPRSQKTEAQMAAQAKYDAATENLQKAGLSWVLDRADPKQKAMVDAAMRKLPRAKQKIVAVYESALNEQVKSSSSGTEGQRRLYDKAVEAGIIKPPETPPTSGPGIVGPGGATPGMAKGEMRSGSKPYDPSSTAMGIIPPLSPFMREDVIPAVQIVVAGITETLEGLRNLLSPVSAGPKARLGAGIIREHAGRLAQKDVQMREKFATAHAAMAKLDKPATLDWLDAVEGGARGTIAGPLRTFANEARSALDDRLRQVQALGTGKLQHFIQDYFPHLWKNPKNALNWLQRIFGKRPLRGPASFLKHRTIPTTREGVDAGMYPPPYPAPTPTPPP